MNSQKFASFFILGAAKETAPQEKELPGTLSPQKKDCYCDGPSVRAGDPFFYAASRRLKEEQRDQEQEERRNCFYCLEGWVFLAPWTTTARRSTSPSVAASVVARAT
jgi:hypothetical protein